jgi:hypothetical protein
VEYFLEVRERLRGLSAGTKARRHSGTKAIAAHDASAVVAGGAGGYGGVAQMREERGSGRWNGRKSRVRITMHDPQRSILEAVFARGDRRLGAVIVEAWKRGARFDAWDETFRNEIWQEAFAATGVDPAFYAHRERPFDELLPWDHIGLHMSRAYLERSYDDLFDSIGATRASARSTALPVLPPG